LEPDHWGVFSQQSRAESVERSDLDGMARRKAFDAASHLVGGLVGERQRQDLMIGDTLLNESSDAMGDDASLSTAWAGEDEQRAFAMENRRPLGIREVA